MKRSMAIVSLLVILSTVLVSCGGTPAPTGPTKITGGMPWAAPTAR
jgi:hypothetical protein